VVVARMRSRRSRIRLRHLSPFRSGRAVEPDRRAPIRRGIPPSWWPRVAVEAAGRRREPEGRGDHARRSRVPTREVQVAASGVIIRPAVVAVERQGRAGRGRLAALAGMRLTVVGLAAGEMVEGVQQRAGRVEIIQALAAPPKMAQWAGQVRTRKTAGRDRMDQVVVAAARMDSLVTVA